MPTLLLFFSNWFLFYGYNYTVPLLQYKRKENNLRKRLLDVRVINIDSPAPFNPGDTNLLRPFSFTWINISIFDLFALQNVCLFPLCCDDEYTHRWLCFQSTKRLSSYSNGIFKPYDNHNCVHKTILNQIRTNHHC